VEVEACCFTVIKRFSRRGNLEVEAFQHMTGEIEESPKKAPVNGGCYRTQLFSGAQQKTARARPTGNDRRGQIIRKVLSKQGGGESVLNPQRSGEKKRKNSQKQRSTERPREILQT